MTDSNQQKSENIRAEIEREFPNDPALQQVHFSRKILSNEAREKGLSLLEYVRSEANSLRERSTSDDRQEKH